MNKGVDSTEVRICIIKCIIAGRSGYEYKCEFDDSLMLICEILVTPEHISEHQCAQLMLRHTVQYRCTSIN